MMKLILTITLSIIISSQAYLQTKSQVKKMEFKITSSAFDDGGTIPVKYSCEGKNISPQLKWNEPQPGIKSYALIVDDPDAPSGDFVHWVVYNIPSDVREMHEESTPSKNVPDEVMMGTNSAGKIGYMGPCPPAGQTHRYFFKLYALDTILHHIGSGATKAKMLAAIKGHILSETHLMGKFKRQ